MRALVTGATGFVGSHLVEALRRRGDEVTALVRSPAKAGWLRSLGVRPVEGDLDDEAALARAAEGQEVVFHVAGLVAARDPADFFRCNRDGTGRVLGAAARAGARRFVLVSSLAAGGPAAPGCPLRGSEPPHPVSSYGRSKLAAEELVRAGPVPWTIVRPPTVYGPRDRELLRLFKLARLGTVPVFGDGSQQLSLVYATDLAEALVAAAGATSGQLYYACHPEIVTSAGLARAVGSAVGRRVLVVPVPAGAGRAALALAGGAARALGRATLLTADKANEFFQPAWIADPAPLTADTGWRARYDLATGLPETYRWYRSAGWM